MIQTLGSTTNFTIQYQDNFPNAVNRAEKLMAGCEAYFAILRGWFNNNSGFGTTNRVTLLVDTEYLARNWGYHSDGTTKCKLEPFDSRGTSDNADDAVLGLFVAEIIEVLMDYQNQKSGTTTWHPASNDGEALSRVAAALLHPDGYYNVLGGPFVNTWMQSNPRKDWISTVESTDSDRDSYGAGMIFLYWLHSQRGYSMHDIVSKGGSTLEATYKNVTGQTGGYNALTNFINPFFPVGQTGALRTDNPFPLLTDSQRSVVISFDESSAGASTIAGHGIAHISAYPFFCSVKDYQYDVVNRAQRLRCTASVQGFAQPIYEWRINGTPAAASYGNFSVNAKIRTDDPNNPYKPVVSSQNVSVNYAELGDTSNYLGMSDSINIYNQDYLGREELLIEVRVHEKYASTDKQTTADIGTVDAQTVDYEPAFYKDRAICKTAFADFSRSHVHYSWIPIILTLPDPPPDLYRSVRILEEIQTDIHELAARNPEAARELTNVVAGVLKVSTKFLQGGG